MGQLGGENQGLFVSGTYNIHTGYIQRNINAVITVSMRL